MPKGGFWPVFSRLNLSLRPGACWICLFSPLSIAAPHGAHASAAPFIHVPPFSTLLLVRKGSSGGSLPFPLSSCGRCWLAASELRGAPCHVTGSSARPSGVLLFNAYLSVIDQPLVLIVFNYTYVSTYAIVHFMSVVNLYFWAASPPVLVACVTSQRECLRRPRMLTCVAYLVYTRFSSLGNGI
ncbi:hypothetical protein C8Q76DRAFT_211065 [Earliella scabrosa]|nr:hypothetical protein C8Q76DRAFT_211065 [Earliella scabrosa]